MVTFITIWLFSILKFETTPQTNDIWHWEYCAHFLIICQNCSEKTSLDLQELTAGYKNTSVLCAVSMKS